MADRVNPRFRPLPNFPLATHASALDQVIHDGNLTMGGVIFKLLLVLIWYETIAYTCDLSALDFVSAR